MRQLFVRVDPRDLDRYTREEVPRHREMPQEKVRQLDLLYRALQSLPPRELQMMYACKVLNSGQEQVCDLWRVRQSNISYRLERADHRIRLFVSLSDAISETQLRRFLVSRGYNENTIRVVLGVVKTTSQVATAEALQLSGGSVRNTFSQVIKRVCREDPDSPACALLSQVKSHYNQLRSIKPQKRWDWKSRGQRARTEAGAPVVAPGEQQGSPRESVECRIPCGRLVTVKPEEVVGPQRTFQRNPRAS